MPSTKTNKRLIPKGILTEFQKLVNKEKPQNPSRKKNRPHTKNQNGIELLKNNTRSKRIIEQCLHDSKEKSFPVQKSTSR